MLVHDFLTRQAGEQGDRVALVDASGTHTYGSLEARANQYARALLAAGMNPDDRVVLALENGADWVSAYFGILKAGGVAVPLPQGPRSDRLPRVVDDCTPTACMTDRATAGAYAAALAHPSLRLVLLAGRATRAPGNAPEISGALSADDVLGSFPSHAPCVRRIDLDLAAIIYTSGSTGAPRGALLSHLNIRSNTDSIVTYLRLTADDRVMVVLPFYYVYGLSLLHTHFRVGGSVVVDNRFAFPNAVVAAMGQHAVTGFSGVPSTFAVLLHHSSIARAHLPSLRYVTQAGGAMAPALVSHWRKVLPHVPFIVMYGATEASARLTYLPAEDLDRKLGSIGKAIPNVEVRVRREDGSEAQPGEVGELVARGSNMSAGYWNAPEETAAAFGPYGYRTGDLGYRDEEGYLYLVGRSRDMLKVGAHRVAAKEIEDVLYEHDDVHEAAVVAAPHALLGEMPLAFVSLRGGADVTDEDLKAHCRRRLAAFKVPGGVEFRKELPKTGAGKIDKQTIRGWVRDGLYRS